jgi:hypothetical protein
MIGVAAFAPAPRRTGNFFVREVTVGAVAIASPPRRIHSASSPVETAIHRLSAIVAKRPNRDDVFGIRRRS